MATAMKNKIIKSVQGKIINKLHPKVKSLRKRLKTPLLKLRSRPAQRLSDKAFWLYQVLNDANHSSFDTSEEEDCRKTVILVGTVK